MYAIQKVRVTVASNGAFKCNAFLLKIPGQGFRLVSKVRLFAPSTENQSIILTPDNRQIAIRGYGVVHGMPAGGCQLGDADGFSTAIVALECNREAGKYRYEPIADVSVLSDNYNFDFDQEFHETITHNASISGIAMKDGYTRQYTYSGMGSYHSNQRTTRFNTPLSPDKPWRIGVELEVYARNQESYNKITGAQSNWFQCESDGSLRESSLGIEIKTIPLKACDAHSVDFWQEPMTRLAQLAKSKGNHSTGLHVHIGKEILGGNDTERQKTLDKLTWFYYYLIEDVPENHAKNVKICGRERGYSTSPDAGKTELAELAKEIGLDALQKSETAFNRVAKSVKDKVSGQRDDINLGHINDYGTIEFRKGKGIIGKTRMAAIVTWWEQMCLYCRDTAPTNLSFNDFFEKVTRENPAVAYFFQQDEEA